MKRGIAILVSLGVLLTVGYFTAAKWAIRHETLTFNDPARDNRPVAVDVAIRRDKEMQANAGMIKLPVAIFNHGNTVKFTEYSFVANVFAARGYLEFLLWFQADINRSGIIAKIHRRTVGVTRRFSYARRARNAGYHGCTSTGSINIDVKILIGLRVTAAGSDIHIERNRSFNYL